MNDHKLINIHYLTMIYDGIQKMAYTNLLKGHKTQMQQPQKSAF